MASKSDVMGKLVMQPASSTYPSIGTAYERGGHTVDYSPRLVRTGKNYYDSKAAISNGRMSTAAEELAIQLGIEKAGQDPRTAGVFGDLFARNDSKTYVWQRTETGLRVPKGRDPDKYETDSKGRKYRARTVLIGDEEVGEILVPEGAGRVVVEWDEVFGLPRTTDNIDFPHNPYTTHFWFNKSHGKYNKSGHYDIAVVRRSCWGRDEGERCLVVAANVGRGSAFSGGGFRPVRGSMSEIKKTVAKINFSEAGQDSNESMQRDYGKIPFDEFLKRYRI